VAIGLGLIVAGAAGASRSGQPLFLTLTSPSLRTRLALGLLGDFRTRYRATVERTPQLIRIIRLTYVANGDHRRTAYLVLPRWYGPRLHPAIPLVISPHGRGVHGSANAARWGDLPAFGPFAVVCPDGQGRRLELYSWGWRGQIDDLARMPAILERSIPWLRIAPHRIYAVGSSMGGQETLLLVALHPQLLAGAAALDSATDMAARYRAFRYITHAALLRAFARTEIGGTPASDPRAYALRSPMHYARELAFSGVPLEIWWSTRDKVVRDQNQESGRLYRAIRRLNPRAPVTEYVGRWRHSREMQPLGELPLVLIDLGLLHPGQSHGRPLAATATSTATATTPLSGLDLRRRPSGRDGCEARPGERAAGFNLFQSACAQHSGTHNA
jgi:poly(3-hydroxybutyrate) depolymerase